MPLGLTDSVRGLLRSHPLCAGSADLYPAGVGKIIDRDQSPAMGAGGLMAGSSWPVAEDGDRQLSAKSSQSPAVRLILLHH